LERRNSSILLIPFIAALALFYPSAARRNSAASTQTQNITKRVSETVAQNTSEAEWHGGRDALQRFFALSNDDSGSAWPDPNHDPRKSANLKFLLATVPDPIDSGLPHSFDRIIAAIQTAAQTQPYFLSDFDLPWEDCLSKGNSARSEGIPNFDFTLKTDKSQPSISLLAAEEQCQRRFRDIPGFLLLSSQRQTGVDLLFIYLIGESPTNGIQKPALITALKEISAYCGWRADALQTISQASGPQSDTCSTKDLRVLGPSFSGSAPSLDLSFSYWLDLLQSIKPRLTMISGSATAVHVSEKLDGKDDFAGIRSRLGPSFSFRSMEIPDVVALQRFWDYLSAKQVCIGGQGSVRVALLSEGNTAYGFHAGKVTGRNCAPEITVIPYPLHISQLRAASEKLRRIQREANPQPQTPTRMLPLSDALEDTGQRRDVEIFSPANSATAEQVLANILSTVEHEGYKYVGIIASDVRDTIFLAQAVHEHAPGAVLFTFNADILFLHPEINPSLRGMLVVSSYPLNNSNQLWSLPSHSNVRLQFPDDASEAVYNATLALLDDEKDIVEFSPPFVDDRYGAASPAVWISVVGTNRLWPVETFDVTLDPRVMHYTYNISSQRAGRIGTTFWWRALLPETALIFLAVVAILCVIFSLPLSRRLTTRTILISDARSAVKTRTGLETKEITYAASALKSTWLDYILGAPLSEEHRRQGELFLLAASASLLAFLIVVATAAAVPRIMIRWRFGSGAWSSGLEQILVTAVFSGCCSFISCNCFSLISV